ncbi:MAG: glutathione S-transferase family protein [Kofleriaceae bacterium]
MKLYGTTTSPYMRRVRVIAEELGVSLEIVNTATEAGLAELKTVSPIWKVPVAVVGETPIFDSHAIIDHLTATHGSWGTKTANTANQVHAIDGALESVMQCFYLKRDGVKEVAGSVFEKRQLGRAAAVFSWLAPQLHEGSFSGGFGIAELALVSVLDWMEFRDAYPVASTGCQAVRERWGERPSLVKTRPHT